MSKQRIIVVSNRLPVKIAETANGLIPKRSDGGLATAMAAVAERHSLLWIGWTGLERRMTKRERMKLRWPENLVPVELPSRLFNNYYNHLANGILWPILHGLKPTRLSRAADWRATQAVTTRFADTILRHAATDDLIWIHDYHLSLLPNELRRLGVTNRLGFFLHTPFPEPKIFTKWRHQRTLLKSLSQVDVLGFQTSRDVAHFRECLKRAGLKMRKGAVVRAFPIGIDFKSYRAALKLSSVANSLVGIRKLVAGERVILSASRLDYTKGIPEQLMAVERILKLYRPGKLFYKLVVSPSRESIATYRSLKAQIDKLVARINSRYYNKHGIRPIDYEYRTYSFEELNAWYRVADVMLVTSKADGMNLMVKEYIAAHEGYPGAVVLSKTMGAAAQLSAAIQVEPFDVQAVAEGLITALTMPTVELRRRWRELRTNVKHEDIFWWSDSFIKALAA